MDVVYPGVFLKESSRNLQDEYRTGYIPADMIYVNRSETFQPYVYAGMVSFVSV